MRKRRKRREKKEKLNRVEIPLRSDQLPDSDSNSWFEGQPLRETVLLMYPEPLRERLRDAGKSLTLGALELGSFDPQLRDSVTGGLLRATERDLRFAARMLAWTAREAIRFSATDEPEADLGWFADDYAMQVEALADQIAARLEGHWKAKESHV